MHCVFPDEINWPDGEDAPPLDAQELITLLLRQNPLERMGAGTRTKSKERTVSNSVRTKQAQQATINSHVTVCATSAPLIIFKSLGKKLRSSSSRAVYPLA